MIMKSPFQQVGLNEVSWTDRYRYIQIRLPEADRPLLMHIEICNYIDLATVPREPVQLGLG